MVTYPRRNQNPRRLLYSSYVVLHHVSLLYFYLSSHFQQWVKNMTVYPIDNKILKDDMNAWNYKET